LNMMKAKIKIIDFGFATQLNKANLTFSAVGSPINMDPIILNKFSKRKDINLGYDTKADIWSIGTVCYELLTGNAVFSAKNINDLADKVDKGNYTLSKDHSKEVITFLNDVLKYEPSERLSAEELLKHPFLTKNVCEFTKIKRSKTHKENIKEKKTEDKNEDKKEDNLLNKPIMNNNENKEKVDYLKRGQNIPEKPFYYLNEQKQLEKEKKKT